MHWELQIHLYVSFGKLSIQLLCPFLNMVVGVEVVVELDEFFIYFGYSPFIRYFAKEDIQIANRHMKRCSTSLITREMQIETTMRCHLMPIRTAIIKKARNTKWWQGYGEHRIFIHCWWECNLVQLPWKTVWRFLKKLRRELLYDLDLLLMDICSKEHKNTNSKKDMYLCVHCSIIYNLQPRHGNNQSAH